MSSGGKVDSDSWEEDVAGQWITVFSQTMVAVESSLQDSSRTLRVRLQGEASLSRQIRVLNGRLMELDRAHKRREQDMAQVLQQAEFVGMTHAQILQKDLFETRRTVQLGETYYHALLTSLTEMQLQRRHQPCVHTSAIAHALTACAAQAGASDRDGGSVAVMQQCSRALSAAWLAIQDRDAKLQVLEVMVHQANSARNRSRLSPLKYSRYYTP